MSHLRPSPRLLGLFVVLFMAGLAGLGFVTIRKDVENLRATSQDNMLWTATQMEVELLQFEISLATFALDGSAENLAELRERFDVVWSRVLTLGTGRVGAVLQSYDEGHGTIAAIAEFMARIDPGVGRLEPGDGAAVREMLVDVRDFRQASHSYTLRVVFGDTARAALLRDRIQTSSQTTAIISLAAAALSLFALVLIMRENSRQVDLAEMSRRQVLEAEASSRAKSRFLTMMSHELRNPLNGVLGPLALLGQSDLAGRQLRLLEQAQQSGRSMNQMLARLLDYAEMQDGRFRLAREPFRVRELAEEVRSSLANGRAAGPEVRVRAGTPELLKGDMERLRQIFGHLGDYILDAGDAEDIHIAFGYEGECLVGEIVFSRECTMIDWKLDLLTGLSDISFDQVSTDALQPLIARGLIASAKGILTLKDNLEGRRALHVAIPAEAVKLERIRVHLETRSAALATIYQAALRSDRIVFATPGSPGPVDLVLVDSTSINADPLMGGLRQRFPDALFVSLGNPMSPESFDDVVERPNDMKRLRNSVLSRLTS